MKLNTNSILTFVLALAPFLGVAQNNIDFKPGTFTLNGKVADSKGIVDNLVYLQFKQNGKEIKDSTQLINGTYSFKGLISYPSKATIQLKVADSVEQYHKQTRLLKDYSHEFYIDAGKLTAVSAGKLNKTTISGSAADSDRQNLKAKLAPLYQASSELYAQEGSLAYKNKDSLAIASFTKKSTAIQDQIDAVKKDFMFSHPQSGMMLDMLNEYTRTILEPSEIEPLFKKIQPALKSSLEGKLYAARIERSKNTAIGALPPDFVLKDRDGKKIRLTSLKGKLVLLDFWGSWCFPCRQTHPHLRELYATYKAKGFEILGVANERGTPEEQYKKWTTALEEDKMSWINVLSEKAEQGKPAVPGLYNIMAYPTKILINRDGKIAKIFVGSGTASAQALDQMIKELL
ncbi:MAG: TlpA disulfide reductase family protein [Candidatus Pedobacter colombiensis]|uniref:TlpA disulfide reductase family protein n=1 Tax=Candidatus Pedobacter colombiensis TaxID=3121371 RepID=A0AAJ6B773_9SPHI|nr:TlpA disulfide reductase family protein [Pedobacter sp.]WEK19935.1 MAG: TlpA disulfide reductase family protein [Pedobacter sp.]